MVLEGVSVGKSPVTGVTLVGFVLAGSGQQSVVLLLADNSHYLAVSRGQCDGVSLHHLLHLLHVLGSQQKLEIKISKLAATDHTVLLHTDNVVMINNFKVLFVLDDFLLHLAFYDLLTEFFLQ